MHPHDERAAKPDTANPLAGGNSRPRRRSLGQWQDLITEQLDEAAAKGAFDDLPGKGRPLRLNECPNEPDDMRMANKLLKDNNLSPAWIGDRRAILADVEKLRTAMRREWEETRLRLETPGVDPSALQSAWARARARWEARIAELNRRIVSLNIALPVWRLELHRLRLREEMDRIGATSTPSRRDRR